MPRLGKTDSVAPVAPRPSPRAFHAAAVAYALWLVFLAVLAVMQRAL